jgi:hypothetical protein
MNMSIAYLDADDLAAIRDRDNDGRDLLVDETSEGNNGFQVNLTLESLLVLSDNFGGLGSYNVL